MNVSSSITYQEIAGIVGDTVWPPIELLADNGVKILAHRKVTTTNGLVRTKYVHIYCISPDRKRYFHVRENRRGNFEQIGRGFWTDKGAEHDDR